MQILGDPAAERKPKTSASTALPPGRRSHLSFLIFHRCCKVVVMNALRYVVPMLLLLRLAAADLEISRPARTWEFLDATGSRAAFFGREDGTLEAWVYPFKILKDLRLRFQIGEQRIPAESVARRIVARPG